MAENQENKEFEENQELDEATTAKAETSEVEAETSENEAETSEAVADEAVESETSETESKGSSKKDKKDAEIDELKERLMRQMAEFDNYRKRTDKEKKANYEIGASDFILKILPVVDNFERGLSAMTEEDKASSFAQGIEMIYKQMMKVLEDAGVTVIETQGQAFDPMLHNAVMQQESEGFESGMIVQEFQKGYQYKDRVLRHSMVAVAP